MPRRDLGKRHTCPVCGTKFYDLGRPEPRCPKCGAAVTEENAVDPRQAAIEKLKAETAGRRPLAPGLDPLATEPEDFELDEPTELTEEEPPTWDSGFDDGFGD